MRTGRMKHLAYFNTVAEYENAFANNELSQPRVVVILNPETEEKIVLYDPLDEVVISLGEDTYLGTDSRTILAFAKE